MEELDQGIQCIWGTRECFKKNVFWKKRKCFFEKCFFLNEKCILILRIIITLGDYLQGPISAWTRIYRHFWTGTTFRDGCTRFPKKYFQFSREKITFLKNQICCLINRRNQVVRWFRLWETYSAPIISKRSSRIFVKIDFLVLERTKHGFRENTSGFRTQNGSPTSICHAGTVLWWRGGEIEGFDVHR